jgi:hypothetical protein
MSHGSNQARTFCPGVRNTGADQPRTAALIRAALEAHAPITAQDRGPAYWIPERIQAPREVVLISAANKQMLTAHFPRKRVTRSGFDLGPLAATVVQGAAVSI